MRSSGSTMSLGYLFQPQTLGLAQLRPEPAVDTRHKAQNPFVERSIFEQRTEPSNVVPADVSFGPFRCLPFQFLLLEGDRQVSLGSRALEILIVLLERPGELITKQELMARVWPNVYVEPANLTVHISALRRALRDGRDGNRFIINIPGRGYSFVASVRYRNSTTEREAPSPGSQRVLLLHRGVSSNAMQQT